MKKCFFIFVATLCMLLCLVIDSYAAGSYYVNLNSTLTLSVSFSGSILSSNWSSSDSRIVSIVDSGIATCQVMGVDNTYGSTAHITCTYKYYLAGSVFTGYDYFTVSVPSGSGGNEEPTPSQPTSNSGWCGEKLKWNRNGDTIIISGEGEMYDYYNSAKLSYFAPWGKNIKRVVIREGCTTIGSGAFRQSEIESIEIPASVKRIENRAFLDCTKLQQIHFPDQLEYIGAYAVNGCCALTEIEIPNVVYGKSGAYQCTFAYCTSLEYVTFQEGIEEIPNYFLGDCSKIKSIHFPSTVKVIGSGALSNCKALEEVVLPDGLTTIGNFTFEYCYKIKQLYIPSSVTTFGGSSIFRAHSDELVFFVNMGSAAMAYATENNIAMKVIFPGDTLYIPSETKVIEQQAFMGCHAEYIYIPKLVENIESKAFAACDQLKAIYFEEGNVNVKEDFIMGCPQDIEIYAPEGSAVADRIEDFKAFLY